MQKALPPNSVARSHLGTYRTQLLGRDGLSVVPGEGQKTVTGHSVRRYYPVVISSDKQAERFEGLAHAVSGYFARAFSTFSSRAPGSRGFSTKSSTGR